MVIIAEMSYFKGLKRQWIFCWLAVATILSVQCSLEKKLFASTVSTILVCSKNAVVEPLKMCEEESSLP